MSDKVKVALLNDGSYEGMEHVSFPVSVYGTQLDEDIIDVEYSELVRVGASAKICRDCDALCFVIGKDCEAKE